MEKQYTVLYIEDEPDNRILVERFLGFEGFQVYTAETGQEGVDKASEILPDVLLIDFNLPDINGFEVIRILSSYDQTRGIPKIIFSATIVKKEKAPPEGPIFYIQKPVDIALLAEKIKYAIENPGDNNKPVL